MIPEESKRNLLPLQRSSNKCKHLLFSTQVPSIEKGKKKEKRANEEREERLFW
jgi:hypothetical protein|tara:strand:- start:364 stop:522 length:159 start_codon:yes stop_codon:yes gene_type:complete